MMNCKTAQQQMALAVGDDLEPTSVRELERHLVDCTDCTVIWKRHQRTFAVLQRSRDDDKPVGTGSVWPAVARKIEKQTSLARRSEFNGWIAGLAVMSACVLVFVFSQGSPVVSHSEQGSGSSVRGGVWDAGTKRSLPRGANPSEFFPTRPVDQEQLKQLKKRFQNDE